MLDIILLTVGKTKTPYYQAAISDYVKRIKPYARWQQQIVKAVPWHSIHQQQQVRQEEGERLKKVLAKMQGRRIVLLDEKGTAMTSLQWAQEIQPMQGICFVIGGALGLAQDILQAYPEHWSLSDLTLPHELAQLVLVEQLYRVATILQEKTYHF
ncbi:MAG: 23S rRNA (pseudouridine(1915)-N(3))-methyltransferase RlmH [Candidatus Komeilibacteria bacterium]